MAFPKACERCGEVYPRPGKQCHFCNKCIRSLFIKRMFKRNGRFKDCYTVEEALEKYGV